MKAVVSAAAIEYDRAAPDGARRARVVDPHILHDRKAGLEEAFFVRHNRDLLRRLQERVAREHYGMLREGEHAYLVVPVER